MSLTLLSTINTQKKACESDKTAEKKVEFGCEELSEEDFEYIHENGFILDIKYDLTCLRFDPRVYAGYERDSCNERWVISWN
jgi:hypothetical protein